jgi:hypothetical protein
MADPDVDQLAQLHKATRIPPKELVGTVPRGNVRLDYLGHAAVTDLLLESDPTWNWEPVAWTDRGMPAVVLDTNGWPVGLWIKLTVHGVTRLGYGTCNAGKDDAIKELIGDALRNAAMRFGVALSLWAKEEWQETGVEAGTTSSQGRGRSQRKTSGKEASKENAPDPGNVSQLPRPSEADVARHPSNGPVLRGDQAIAALAAKLGLDEQTRIDVIRAVSGGAYQSGKELNAEQVTKAMRNLRWLADGFVQLDYDPDGVPSLRDTTPSNPGPSNPRQRVDG